MLEGGAESRCIRQLIEVYERTHPARPECDRRAKPKE